MQFSKLVIIVSIVGCGFAAAAQLTKEQKTKCTFTCANHVKLTAGGCARPIGSDSQGNPTGWELIKAHSTENHKAYFNCIGTEMAFSTCCLPDIFSKDGTTITINGDIAPLIYHRSCQDTSPQSTDFSKFPKDCKN
ncbi:hypothetical protein PGT21_035192 [Puccinia graminis f. sp. tritici]|uniref:Secreted protein n=1 Tax=Puccinia graminis f. sp. tritici TaxID=56615 RepID=A0A5B0PK28_PUCGR|nr:hypothetical protein PGT21_035192 [Puccinia graminis f. sp. tritici]KAA1100269.1 hypothetical protein PGTUg99_004689 [Puccinia graminis f. sp. tritici]